MPCLTRNKTLPPIVECLPLSYTFLSYCNGQGPICKKKHRGVANSRCRRRRGGWGGGVLIPTGGGGCAPSPENFLIFHLKIVSFSAFWGVFSHSSAALFTAKISVFWLTEHFLIYCIIKWRVLVDCDVLHAVVKVGLKRWGTLLSLSLPSSPFPFP